MAGEDAGQAAAEGKGILFSARSLEVALPDMAAKPLFGRAPMIRILNGIDLDISRGSVLGIVGESRGRAKSTLGRCSASGCCVPPAGAIEFDGT
jgi:ABC-type dipeptide/oligopeptide/nickel transport system ATPase subunit